MLIKRLLDHFDDYETLHIDVNDVRDQLINMGIQDQIRFHFVKMDKDKIRGLLHRYTRRPRPYAEPILCSDIVIPAEMGEEAEAWQRLVAVKELLHITDCVNLTAESEDAVNNLFEKFSLPPELRRDTTNGSPEKASYLNDRVRIYFALAVLLPLKCRAALRPLYIAQLSDREIAQISKIPIRYIPTLMGEDFEELIKAFLNWELLEQPN